MSSRKYNIVEDLSDRGIVDWPTEKAWEHASDGESGDPSRSSSVRESSRSSPPENTTRSSESQTTANFRAVFGGITSDQRCSLELVGVEVVLD